MGTASDLANDALAVVLAGGKGTPLGALTHDLCKPAVPFGARYRNIDFTLSNCVNSGLSRIGIATQHRPEPLLRHLDEAWRDRVTGPGEPRMPCSATWKPSGTQARLFRTATGNRSS